jgi:hypothetical protein
MRINFRQIVEASRVDAAEAAWERAKLASRLRHLESGVGRRRNANRLADSKLQAIRLAMSLAPEQISVTIDDNYQVGLLSVRWPGHGRLHLPAEAYLV